MKNLLATSQLAYLVY